MDTLEFHKSMKVLSNTSSIPKALECFLEQIGGPYLYFSWRKNQSALQLLYSKPKISSELIRLYESDPSFDLANLKEPLKIRMLQNLVQKVSPKEKLFPYWIHIDQEPFGLFFLPDDSLTTQNLLYYVELKCHNFYLQKQLQEQTPQEEFLKTLYTEISRSRRLGLPITLILIQCSSEEPLDPFLKSLYNHLEKTSRIYDLASVLNSKEIALLLPHTSEQAGLEKAEKIYWTLQSLNQTEILKKPVHFQIAIAEYPKSARDASNLLQLARDACAYGQSKQTGIVIAEAPQGFKPDFQVQNESGNLCEWV